MLKIFPAGKRIIQESRQREQAKTKSTGKDTQLTTTHPLTSIW